jgi:signal transduction histidine kinase
MTEPDPRLRQARHDLSNPLAGILAETQMLLLDQDKLPPDAVEALRTIEKLARRMRDMLEKLV